MVVLVVVQLLNIKVQVVVVLVEQDFQEMVHLQEMVVLVYQLQLMEVQLLMLEEEVLVLMVVQLVKLEVLVELVEQELEQVMVFQELQILVVEVVELMHLVEHLVQEALV
jgi:hypothetical protein